MPARSIAQQRLFAIAEHSPSKLYKRNRALAKLGAAELRKFASTKHRGLPATVNSRNSLKKRMMRG